MLLCGLLSMQMATAQDTPVNDMPLSPENTLLLQKAEKERIKAEEKVIREREKEVKAAEKAQKNAEKAQKKAEKELKKQQKAIAKKAKAESAVEKIKSKIAKQEKELKKNTEKYNKLKLRGKLSDKDEIKWSQKLLKYQSNALDLKNDLEKAQHKLRKL